MRHFASTCTSYVSVFVSVSVCLSVHLCLSQVGVVSKGYGWIDVICGMETFSTYPTVCYKEILVSRKGFFPLELFPKLRTLQNFTTAYPLLKRVMN